MRAARCLALAVALLVAACGGSTPAAPTGGDGGAGAQPSDGGGAVASDFILSFPPYVAPSWPPVHGMVRVLNIYFPGTGAAFPIDVVQSAFGGNGRPLVTVPPETVSDYFDPGDEGDGGTQLSFFKSGTQTGSGLMSQGWSNMTGKQITMVVESAVQDAPASGQPYGAATYVREERGGSSPTPTPGSGDALVFTDVQPLDETLPEDKGWVAPAMGTGDGKCLTAVGEENGAAGFSYLDAQQPFRFPGGKANVSVWTGVSNPSDCTGTPAFGPVALDLAAGESYWLVFYANDQGQIKTLLAPIR